MAARPGLKNVFIRFSAQACSSFGNKNCPAATLPVSCAALQNNVVSGVYALLALPDYIDVTVDNLLKCDELQKSLPRRAFRPAGRACTRRSCLRALAAPAPSWQ
jgi:hypothetical protein